MFKISHSYKKTNLKKSFFSIPTLILILLFLLILHVLLSDTPFGKECNATPVYVTSANGGGEAKVPISAVSVNTTLTPQPH